MVHHPIPAAPVGAYTIHFQNGQEQPTPLRYGKEIASWDWLADASPPEAVWQTTDAAGIKVRLIHYAWDDPNLEVPVATIDFSTTADQWGPFLVAISVED